jgi:gas vesicle protein
MLQRNLRGIAIGAVVGTLLGTFASLLIPKRKKIMSVLKNNNWIDKAKSVSESVLDEFHYSDKSKYQSISKFVQGALTGLALGAGTALLITSKVGQQLQNRVTKKYSEISDKTEDLMQYINNGIKSAPKKSSPSKRRPSVSKRKDKIKVPTPTLE